MEQFEWYNLDGELELLDEAEWESRVSYALEAYVHEQSKINIKSVFEEQCAELTITPDLAKRIIQYQLHFVNKNEDHVKFFGGHLTGVQVVRFTTNDHAFWFEDILGIDEDPLRQKLHALPNVHVEHKVASDTFNLSCIWLLHALHASPFINDTLKHQAMVSTLLVLQYKFITSRLYIHFRYPADEAVAEAAYASLSRKFALKQYGSWGVLLNARAESMIESSGLHYRTITKLDNDIAIEYFLNDVKTRINDMLKNIVNVTFMAAAQNKRVTTVSSVVEHDGKEILRDRSKNVIAYTRYITSIIPDKSSFIREELLQVIEKMIHTAPPKLFRGTLEWMADHYRTAKGENIEELVREIMVHSFDHFATHQNTLASKTDLPGLLTSLKGVYSSARSSDEVLLTLRRRMEHVVQLATKSHNVSLLPPTRTAVMLYIVLRALTKKHYVNSV